MEKTVSRNRKIALTGALCALVVVLGMPPLHLGMIPLGPNASITIMHIPVLLAVMLTGGASALASGIAVGTVFAATLGEGLISGLISLTGIGLTSLSFIPNPLLVYLGYPLLLITVGFLASVPLTAGLRRGESSEWLNK